VGFVRLLRGAATARTRTLAQWRDGAEGAALQWLGSAAARRRRGGAAAARRAKVLCGDAYSAGLGGGGRGPSESLRFELSGWRRHQQRGGSGPCFLRAMAAARLGVGVDGNVGWLREEVVVVELVGSGWRDRRDALPEAVRRFQGRAAVELEYGERRPTLLVEELGGGGVLRRKVEIARGIG
jgi:hypothetical protein